MSHTMNIAIEMKDLMAVKSAAKRLGLKTWEGEVTLFSSKENGFAVALPNWEYPIVIKADGKGIAYDNYNGRWGEEKELKKFQAFYGLEKAKREALKKGYRTYESVNEVTKEISLKIQVGR